jgi:thioredoxin-like negative regulator of GroEL
MWKLLVNEQDFSQIINNNKKAIVSFFTDYCPSCHRLYSKLDPLLAKQAQSQETVALKIDAMKFPRLTSALGITAVPTLIMFEGGEMTKEIIGDKDEIELKHFLYH